MTKISVKDWRNLPINEWNVTTFRCYLADQHENKFGIPYITKNYQTEGSMLKTTIKQFGQEATKLFIDKCLDDYTPKKDYPGISYGFMYSFMRSRIMPIALSDLKRKQIIQKAEDNNDQFDDGWL
jgi:hypothetical protein